MDEIVWGGSGIEKVVFDYILNHIPKGSVIVELGAGHVSTRALCEHYKLYSVEHNKQYIGHYKSNYIFAPNKNSIEWYDVGILKRKLPPKKDQKLIFIDGHMRHGILDHLDLFNPDAMYLIHDTYREGEIELTKKLAAALGKNYEFHTEGDYWSTIYG